MAGDSRTPEKSFLRRWSQRKLAAARDELPPERNAAAVAAPPVAPPTAPAAAKPVAVVDVAKPELPPLDSLSFDSDFTAFLKPGVDPSLQRQALKKLFADPRFNVMDGLDVYIDDYSKFEPIPPELVAKLNQARHLFDPPKTRVNDEGHVEDVPDEPQPSAARAEPNPPATAPTETDGIAPDGAEAVDEVPPPAVPPSATPEKSR